MLRWIQSHISAKLFLTYFAVIFIYSVFLTAAVNLVIPAFFTRHMLSMGEGMSSMMQNMLSGSMMGDLFESVRVVFFQSLFVGLIVAFLSAILASALFSRSMIQPVREMMDASERIAEGRFHERVRVAPVPDELDQLAIRFNQMAEKLQQTEKMRTHLIGDVSHELRTPLSAIKGTMEALEDGILPADASTFQQIQREAARLERLVEDLQELSRVEAGAYPLEPHAFDLILLTQNAIQSVRPNFSAKDLGLLFRNRVQSIEVFADKDRTNQVLVNLLANACQYTPAGGWVEVAVDLGEDQALVSVQDSGVGIPREHLDHVFTRFYRVDKSRSRAHGGSGIGLTIAKHLVEAQGGRIWAESEGEGKGSVFSFSLPLKQF